MPNLQTAVLPRPGAYSESEGVRLLQELAQGGAFVFSMEEAKQAAARVGIPLSYLRQLLSRLAAGGWIVRLRRGLYAGTGNLPGAVHLPPFVVGTRLANPAAISHWSAMNFHGLTEQLPRVVTVSVSRRLFRPGGGEGEDAGAGTREVLGVRYEFVRVEPARFFGIETVWVEERFQVPITDRERTLLDGFVAPRRFGGVGEVLGILEEHLHELQLAKLTEYALRYGKASVAKRLGWALHHLGAPESAWAPLAEVPLRGCCVLDPTRSRRGPCDRRWQVQENLAAEPAR